MASTVALAIETTTTTGSVVLVENPNRPDERLILSRQWSRDRSHAEVLGPALESIASDPRAGCQFSKLSWVAVGQGPGSFTGIRVGINAARALGWTLKIPVVTVTSTENLIATARGSGAIPSSNAIIAVLPAQMGMLFAEIALPGYRCARPRAFELKHLVQHAFEQIGSQSAVCLIGTGSALVQDELTARGMRIDRPSVDLDFPTAYTAARIADQLLVQKADPTDAQRLLQGRFGWQHAQPLYIRGSGAEENLA